MHTHARAGAAPTPGTTTTKVNNTSSVICQVVLSLVERSDLSYRNHYTRSIVLSPIDRWLHLNIEEKSPRLSEPTDPCAPSSVPVWIQLHANRVSTFYLSTCFMPQTPALMVFPKADLRMWTITCPVPVQGLLSTMTVPERDCHCYEYLLLAPGRLQQYPWTAKSRVWSSLRRALSDGKSAIELSALLVHWRRCSSSSSSPCSQLFNSPCVPLFQLYQMLLTASSPCKSHAMTRSFQSNCTYSPALKLLHHEVHYPLPHLNHSDGCDGRGPGSQNPGRQLRVWCIRSR
ncbi:uncharacterized protein BKA78DRAFT_13572 [Phyllosticta capitalensis]|uniref:uncharacterized protein n=1 Tax=Phyllosticta capitalensis TaxID=121624 RepID=UPI00312E2FA2